jgi:triosephosphate isomerase (TIM)
MKQLPVLAGNWKMNHGPAATTRFFGEFLGAYQAHPDRRVIFFPPSISIPAAIQAVRDRPDIEIGIQNVHWESAGAFTGEISAPIAADAGVRVALTGHSERRHIFGETDEQVGRKAVAALAAGLDVMICAGETFEQRQAGQLETVLGRQFDEALGAIGPDEIARVCLAYEPVWAIGTGVNATPDDASAAHAFLRGRLADRYGAAGNAVSILYGGSVNPANAGALLAAQGVDGLLVGGASLKAASFAAIASTD